MHITRVTPAAIETLTPRRDTPPVPARSGRIGAHWPAWLDTILSRRVERRQLLAMEERDLRDIGLTPAEALALARRPLWRR